MSYKPGVRIAGFLFAVSAFAALLIVLLTWAFTSGPFGYYSPTPESQSAFFRNYTQQHVEDVTAPFASESEGSSSGQSASAGRKFVTNTRTLEPRFAAEPEKSALLLTALGNDLTVQLSHDGAEILSRTGDPRTGLHFTYRIGRTLGYATLSGSLTNRFAPHYTMSGAMVAPPEGTQYMAADIAISEQWFPKEAKAIQASLQTH